MKLFSSLLSAGAALTILTFGSSSMQAANEFTRGAHMAKPHSTAATTTFPGVGSAFVAAGLPVSGFLPCFSIYCVPEVAAGIEEINIPLSVLVRGTAYQMYFPVETTHFSGELDAALVLQDSTGATTTVLSGLIDLSADEVNVYYTTATVTIPTTLAAGPGYLTLEFIEQGTTVVKTVAVINYE